MFFHSLAGCASAISDSDVDGDGLIRRGEYLGFVNQVADLLCITPRPVLDLELQTVFLSIACLCEDREGFGGDCCFGNDAGIIVEGADDADTRTQEEQSYLKATCLLTQQVLGPEQCREPQVVVGGGTTGEFGRVTLPPALSDTDDNDLLWLLLLLILLLLCCCIACCCKRNDKEVEEEWETTVKEEVTTVEPEKLMPMEEPPEPEEMEIAAAPLVPPATLPDEEEEDGAGRRFGEAPDEDGDDEFGRRFGGEGLLPPKPEFEGIKLRHVEKEPPAEYDYEYPERNIEETKLKREDSGQVLDHYVPDGGVFIPERAKKAPVEMPTPKYERQKKPEPVYIDPRKQRMQLAIGDGEVWEALANWEDEQQKEGKLIFDLISM